MRKKRGTTHKLAVFVLVTASVLASFSLPQQSGWVGIAGADLPGWSNDTRLSFTGGAEYPTIAASGNIVHTAWRNMSSTTDHFDLTYCRSLDGGITWEPEKNLTCYTAGTHLAEEPRIAVNGSDVFVVFTDDRSGMREIYFMNSSNNGVTWSQERNLSNLDLMYSAHPDIAVWNDNIYVVWEDDRGQRAEVWFRNSSDGGATWGQEMNLTADDDRSSTSPSIDIWEDNVHVAFNDYRNLRWEVYYKKSLDGGEGWIYEKPLSKIDGWNSGITAGRNCIAVNGSTLHIVWRDANSTSTQEVFYRVSQDNGENWEPERFLSTDDGYWSAAPNIAAKNDRVQVTWTDLRDQYPYSNAGEIYGNCSVDSGQSWGGETRLTIAPNSSIQSTVFIVDGITHLVWSDNRTGDVYDKEIYYKRAPDFPTQTYDAVVPLKLGWNLLTVPLNITDWTASNLCQEIETNTSLYVLVVCKLNQGTYSSYLYRDGATWHRLDGTDGYMDFSGVNDFSIQPGMGYLVFLDGTDMNDTIWELSGEKFTDPVTASFGSGWNFMGAPYHTTLTVNASDMMDQIDTQNGADICLKVSNWTTSDTWESWDGTIGEDFILDDADHPMDANGRAWAVLCNNTGTWTPL